VNAVTSKSQNAIREPQTYNRDFIHHVAGMIDTAARVVGLTPREIIDRVIQSIHEPEFHEGFEKRVVEIELNPSEWAAVEEIARAHNGGDDPEPSGIGMAIAEAARYRFTVKELATMTTGGLVDGLYQVQAAAESAGRFAQERAARKARAA